MIGRQISISLKHMKGRKKWKIALINPIKMISQGYQSKQPTFYKNIRFQVVNLLILRIKISRHKQTITVILEFQPKIKQRSQILTAQIVIT